MREQSLIYGGPREPSPLKDLVAPAKHVV